MEFPDPSEAEQEPEPNAHENHTAGEPLKPNTRSISHAHTFTHHPGVTGRQPGSKPEGRPASGPLAWSDQAARQRTGKNINPGRKLHAFEAAVENNKPGRVPWHYRLHPNRELTRRAYWDVAATFSLIVNAILIGLLLMMAGQVRNLRTTVNSLFGGLYGNLTKMDQASINTTILLNVKIPFNFNLPVSQNTEMVLNRDVNIPNAHLVISSGILRINTQANVTLPAGTTLPIALNLNIPVLSTLPINLQVPVSIPVNQTELHEPITGLQASLRSLYCTLDKNAQYPEGIYICAKNDVPTPGTP
jgi:hypothetical protein